MQLLLLFLGFRLLFLYWTYGFLLFVVVKCVLRSSMPCTQCTSACVRVNVNAYEVASVLFVVAFELHTYERLYAFNTILTLLEKFTHLAFVHQTEWGHRFLSMFLFCFVLFIPMQREKCMLNGVQLQSIKHSFSFLCWFVCVKHKIKAFIPHLNHWNRKTIDFFVSNSVNIVRQNIECFGFNRSNVYELFRFYCFENFWKLSFKILCRFDFKGIHKNVEWLRSYFSFKQNSNQLKKLKQNLLKGHWKPFIRLCSKEILKWRSFMKTFFSFHRKSSNFIMNSLCSLSFRYRYAGC